MHISAGGCDFISNWKCLWRIWDCCRKPSKLLLYWQLLHFSWYEYRAPEGSYEGKISLSHLKLNKSDLSKRDLLSIECSIFNSLIFIMPVMIFANVMLRGDWATNSYWYLSSSEELPNGFLKLYKELSLLLLY